MTELTIVDGELREGQDGLLSNAELIAQIEGEYIYNDRRTKRRNRVATWDGEYLYEGERTKRRNRVATWDEEYLYEGERTKRRNRVATWDGEYLYEGERTKRRNQFINIEDATQQEAKLLAAAYLTIPRSKL